jgi:hypothetical protein
MMILNALIGAALILVAGAASTPSASKPTAAKPDAGKVKYNSIFPTNIPDSTLEPIRGEIGVWDADVELYVGDPAKQPIRKTAVQTNRLVSNGRHMLNEFRYADGSYEGTGMWGWDAYHNRYTGIWMDGDHHLIRHDTGYYDSATKTLRWEADTLQPNGVTTRMRLTEIFAGPTRTFQMDVMDAKTGEYKKLIFMRFRKRAEPEKAKGT